MEDGLYLQSLGAEVRACRFADDRLVDLGVWRRRQPLPGDIYLARVSRLDRTLGLAFCELGEGPAGVLPLDQAPKDLTDGMALPLRLVRAAAPGKGPKLAPARGPAAWRDGAAPRLLERRADPLARFLAPAPPAVFLDRAAFAGDLRDRGLDPRVVPGGFSGAVASRLDAEIEALLQPRVALAGGASLLFEPGETLSAIDVNLGGAGRGKAASAARTHNLAVLPEIARQLRLRALAGRIVVDVLAVAAGDRRTLKEAMTAALADDPEPAAVKLVTPTGLMELTRRRGLLSPLHELLCEPAGLFAGRRLTLRAEAAQLVRRLAARRRETPGARLRLVIAPDLLAQLEALEDWSDLSKGSLAVESREPGGDARYRLEDQR